MRYSILDGRNGAYIVAWVDAQDLILVVTEIDGSVTEDYMGRKCFGVSRVSCELSRERAHVQEQSFEPPLLGRGYARVL